MPVWSTAPTPTQLRDAAALRPQGPAMEQQTAAVQRLHRPEVRPGLRQGQGKAPGVHIEVLPEQGPQVDAPAVQGGVIGSCPAAVGRPHLHGQLGEIRRLSRRHPLFGGVLSQVFGMRTSFFIATGALFFNFIMLLVVIKEPPHTLPSPEEKQPSFSVLKSPIIRDMLLFAVLVQMVIFLVQPIMSAASS